MSYPPHLRPDGVNPRLHRAYTDWAEHHRTCETCGSHDWYTPGDLVEVDSPTIADYIAKDKTCWRRAPDVSVLCRAGRPLFRAWEYYAMTTKAFGTYT